MSPFLQGAFLMPYVRAKSLGHFHALANRLDLDRLRPHLLELNLARVREYQLRSSIRLAPMAFF
jgi:hypothetical protein